MRRLLLFVVSLAFVTACTSPTEEAARTSSSLVVTDEVNEVTVAGLQRFEVIGKRARATVLGLGADVTVHADGRLRFDPTPMTDPGGRDVTPGWHYETSLKAIGRAGSAADAIGRPGELARTSASTVEQRWSNHTVRYTHRGVGLKQDVVLSKRPTGEGNVELSFGVSGPINLVGEDATIAAHYGGSPVLRWTGLEVFDANGATLEAQMFVRGEDVVIRFSDKDAAYPVTVDPLAVSPYWSPDRTGGVSNRNFGFKVKWAGDVDQDGFDDVLVSEPQGRVNFVGEGRVYVFLSPNGIPNAIADVAIAGGAENAFFGQSITSAGDVDQDGYDDIAIGASNGTDTVSSEGVVYLFRGLPAPAGLTSSAAWTQGSGQAGSSFGVSLDSGDFNCDGRADLVVGAALWDEPGSDRIGKALVYYADGSANFYGATPWERIGPAAESRFGSNVAQAGNVNGDQDAGYPCDDLMVGAANYTPAAGLGSAGRVELYTGGASGISTAPLFTTDGTQASLFLGSVMTSLGDTNGDGLADVALGAQRWDENGTDRGAVFVHLGDATTGLVSTPQQTILGPSANARFGFGLSGGDLNGDGLGDLVASAPLSNVTANGNEGLVVAHVGSNGVGIDAQRAWEATGNEIDSRFGFFIHSGGDVDNDGFDDLLVGAPLADANGVLNAGTVYIYRGGQTCRIGGNIYQADALNPQNPCEFCDVSNPSVWTSAVDGSACAEDSVCGANRTCQAGICTGSGQTCDDGDPCTDDICDGNGNCQFTTLPDGASCGSDPDPCVTLTCSAGACVPDTVPSSCSIGGICYTDGAVNPNDPCAICDPATSTTDWSQAPAGMTCTDGLFCTVGETCDATGTCGGGTQRDCSGAIDTCSNNPFCNEGEKRCQGRPTNEGGVCDDGNPCTDNDSCSAGICTGSDIACPIGDECSAFACNAGTGACESVAVTDGTDCGLAPGEACFGGQCVEPIPEAVISGQDTIACEDTIELGGSGSNDARGLPLTYTWRQVSPMTPDVIGSAPTDGQFLDLSNDGQFDSDTVVTIGLTVDNGYNPSAEETFEVTFAGCTMMEPEPGDAGMDAGSEMDAGMEMDAGTEMDAGVASDLGSDMADPAGPSGELSGSGCGCASSDGSAPGSLLVLLVGLVMIRRRRR